MKKAELEKGTFGIFPASLCRGLPALQQVVLAWLWEHKNKEGTCFPSLNTLAFECGMSKASVCRSLNELEEGGFIRRTKRTIKKINGKIEYISTIYKVFLEKNKTTKHSTKTPTTLSPTKTTLPHKETIVEQPNPVKLSSEEDSEQSSQSPEFFEKKGKEYGDPHINQTLKVIKKILKVDSFTQNQRETRRYGNLLVNLMKKLHTSEFKRRMDLIFGDGFKRQNCNSLKFIYSQIKGFIEVPPEMKRAAEKDKPYDPLEGHTGKFGVRSY